MSDTPENTDKAISDALGAASERIKHAAALMRAKNSTQWTAYAKRVETHGLDIDIIQGIAEGEAKRFKKSQESTQ